MVQFCPSCGGARRPDRLDKLAAFDHRATCDLLAEERETLATDQGRRLEPGRTSSFRPATSAERRLLAASGMAVPVRAQLYTEVSWPSPGFRHRSWTRQPIVSVDELPAVGSSTGPPASAERSSGCAR